MAKQAPKCPKVAKNDTFCFITFDPSIVFSETLKCEGNFTKYKATVTDLGKTLVRVPPGTFMAKKHPFLGLFFKFIELLTCMSI